MELDLDLQKRIIPEWAHPYFETFRDLKNIHIFFALNYPREEFEVRKKFFNLKRKELKNLYTQIDNWSKYDRKTIEGWVTEYILCNLGAALLEQKFNELYGGRHKNSGASAQHWIPKCYMRHFANKISNKQEIVVKTNVRTPVTPIREKITINLDHADFREPKRASGKFYEPELELMLSKLELDYGLLNKSSQAPKNLWDFIVLTVFFLVLDLRNKDRRDRIYALSEVGPPNEVNVLLSLITKLPQIISELEVYAYDRRTILATFEKSTGEKALRIPFTQYPVKTEEFSTGPSFWCLYTRDCLLWFRNKNSRYPIKNDPSFYFQKLIATLEDKYTQALYFHPDDTVWNANTVPGYNFTFVTSRP